ncbi:hypothetical protein DSD19_19900 [Rhodovulum sp. BSW8]|uniref:Uncharacterized protein n=2 Tax=Rhodovulum TaxID=34008 RepID=A0A4R8FZZ7_9RHOB|nr:hypothetical protein [Rhodovulum visakhapatnamense]RBO51381.1 hypothetical protein DSD19_19900 [Rhodovulum sp. BSW8]TDX31289.1 hypothetical protein EV657_105136 [Rhodovulum visakhapatnamense]
MDASSMDATSLIATLALGTLCAVVVFAWVSKRRTEARKADPDAPKSTLAADAPSTRSDGKGAP